MRIGELARRTGVSRRSLRYYEQRGLLHARRGHNGWRDYDESAVQRVRTIAEMIASGLTLEGVKQLEPCLAVPDWRNRANPGCDNPDLAFEIYRARLAVVDERLADLQRHRDRLARYVEELQAAHIRSS
jgi:DNA-binding transcriptional MerR regulator